MSTADSLPEDLVQYAWQTLQFDLTDLRTVDGRQVEVRNPGTMNPNQGPDFLFAEVVLDGIALHGNVEIHTDGADWIRHGHHEDTGFNGVVLHVVQQPGRQPARTADGATLPELVIGHRLNNDLRERYARLQLSGAPFPCANMVHAVPMIHRRQWISTMGWERVMDKVRQLEPELAANTYDWPELIWQQLAGALAGPVNKFAFRELATRVPLHILQKYRDDPDRLEALLFGAAEMLVPPEGEAPDTFIESRCELWMHLAHKHSLQPIQGAQFKFSRLRPPGFPTVRLAQLAAIVHRVPDIMLLAAEPWQVPEILRELELSPYWTTHYKPGQPSKAQPKRIGKQFVDTLLINCFIPIAVLYYRTLGKNEATNRVIDYMQRLKPENNRIVRRYSDYDFPAESALDTQGILHLERHYCRQSHCLSCAIGHQLMRAPKSSKTSSSS